MFTVTTEYETYPNCTMSLREYANGHAAIQLYCEEGPLATLTVNIPGIERYDNNYSCVDTNNCPWAEELIEELGIGEPVGIGFVSGFCTYPVYKFKFEKIKNLKNESARKQ